MGFGCNCDIMGFELHVTRLSSTALVYPGQSRQLGVTLDLDERVKGSMGSSPASTAPGGRKTNKASP